MIESQPLPAGLISKQSELGISPGLSSLIPHNEVPKKGQPGAADSAHKNSWLEEVWTQTSQPLACCCCLVAKLCPTPRNPMDCSMPGFTVLHSISGGI